MAVKAKRFRIGVEGATTDGRNIERARLEQMAASYDPQVYTALINLEHIKGYTLIAHSAVSGPWISWRQRRLQTAI
nr:Phage capsid scaffolding protein (GPO) serine peptidase [Klebsiella pneumoniae]